MHVMGRDALIAHFCSRFWVSLDCSAIHGITVKTHLLDHKLSGEQMFVFLRESINCSLKVFVTMQQLMTLNSKSVFFHVLLVVSELFTSRAAVEGVFLYAGLLLSS